MFTPNSEVFIIQCYAPTNDTDDQIKSEFYQQLQTEINSKTRKDVLIVMGDLNAKI